MSSRILTTTLLCAALASPVFAERGARMDVGQAIDLCTKRAVNFGRRPFGPYAEEPPPDMVQTAYRQCVYANAKVYPSLPVRYRETIQTLLRDAF